MPSTKPIGIFDSGVGGLTLAKALHSLLPQENLLYFGDTAHTPWGDKSIEAIRSYAQKIVDFLLEKHCKLILIACHTASATAWEFIQEHTNHHVPIINVINPVIENLRLHYANQTIGLIGTKQTIYSKTYQHKIKACHQNIQMKVLATPLLCPLVEEGLPLDHPLHHIILKEYLTRPELNNINALLLGCTHYPLLKPAIEAYYQNTVDIIDSETIIAKTIQQTLTKNHLLNPTPGCEKKFYVSDDNRFFESIANYFFADDITLTPMPLF